MEYKHYIRIDSQNRIIKTFSDAFEKPEDGDILVADTDERHFNLDIIDDNGFPVYEWDDNKIVRRTILTVDEKQKIAQALAMTELEQSDRAMIRGIDDIVNLLIEKKIIEKSELPVELQDKLSIRENLRSER